MPPTDPLTDRFQRHLNYLRVSITDHCNLNCIYCRPAGCTTRLRHADILSYEEILRVLSIATRLGVTKIRITGGEPLVRKDACRFLEEAAALPGVNDISMTTNGVLLKKYLADIKAAGIKRLNISLDTFDRQKFARITGHDAFDRVWEGIRAALEAGFTPVKLNMVVMRGINDDEIVDFARLTYDCPVHVRFIEYMPAGDIKKDPIRGILSPEIKQRLIARAGDLIPVNQTDNSHTAERFRLPGAPGEIGFISPVSKHFCRLCNRLRLTADGRLKPCLLYDRTRDIKTPLRAGKPDEDLNDVFRQAVLDKPAYHNNRCRRQVFLPERMSAIGG